MAAAKALDLEATDLATVVGSEEAAMAVAVKALEEWAASMAAAVGPGERMRGSMEAGVATMV